MVVRYQVDITSVCSSKVTSIPILVHNFKIVVEIFLSIKAYLCYSGRQTISEDISTMLEFMFVAEIFQSHLNVPQL